MSEKVLSFFKKFRSILPSIKGDRILSPNIYKIDGIISTLDFEYLIKHLDAGYVAVQSGNVKGFIFQESTTEKYMCVYPSTNLPGVFYKDIISNKNFRINENLDKSQNLGSELYTKAELRDRFNGNPRYYIIKTDAAFWELNHFANIIKKDGVEFNSIGIGAGRAFKNLVLIMRSVFDQGKYPSVNDLLAKMKFGDDIEVDLISSNNTIFIKSDKGNLMQEVK